MIFEKPEKSNRAHCSTRCNDSRGKGQSYRQKVVRYVEAWIQPDGHGVAGMPGLGRPKKGEGSAVPRSAVPRDRCAGARSAQPFTHARGTAVLVGAILVFSIYMPRSGRALEEE
eukprot:6599781-Lingulodinium_polyedra.AAC.1